MTDPAPLRVMISPAARAMMNAGTWLTSPSPIVSFVYAARHSLNAIGSSRSHMPT